MPSQALKTGARELVSSVRLEELTTLTFGSKKIVTTQRSHLTKWRTPWERGTVEDTLLCSLNQSKQTKPKHLKTKKTKPWNMKTVAIALLHPSQKTIRRNPMLHLLKTVTQCENGIFHHNREDAAILHQHTTHHVGQDWPSQITCTSC